MKIEEKIIMIDIDDTLVDTSGAVEEELAKLHNLTASQLSKIIYWNKKSKYYKDVQNIMNERSFYEEKVRLTEYALEAIHLFIKNKFKVILVTAEPSFKLMEFKKNMIESRIPNFDTNKNLIRCIDKSLIRADYIIDDHPQNIEDCSEYMQAIIFNHKSNKKCKGRRVNNLMEAYSLIVTDMF